MLKVSLGNMRCRAWASNTKMRVLHPTAGCLRKKGLHNHQPLLCVPAHPIPNNTWKGWPTLALELQNNSYWMSLSAEESKVKFILTIWVTKLFGLDKMSRGHLVPLMKCQWVNAFFLIKKKNPLTYIFISQIYALYQLTGQLRHMYLY